MPDNVFWSVCCEYNLFSKCTQNTKISKLMVNSHRIQPLLIAKAHQLHSHLPMRLIIQTFQHFDVWILLNLYKMNSLGFMNQWLSFQPPIYGFASIVSAEWNLDHSQLNRFRKMKNNKYEIYVYLIKRNMPRARVPENRQFILQKQSCKSLQTTRNQNVSRYQISDTLRNV